MRRLLIDSGWGNDDMETKTLIVLVVFSQDVCFQNQYVFMFLFVRSEGAL